jgi:hypothetical protein
MCDDSRSGISAPSLNADGGVGHVVRTPFLDLGATRRFGLFHGGSRI